MQRRGSRWNGEERRWGWRLKYCGLPLGWELSTALQTHTSSAGCVRVLCSPGQDPRGPPTRASAHPCLLSLGSTQTRRSVIVAIQDNSSVTRNMRRFQIPAPARSAPTPRRDDPNTHRLRLSCDKDSRLTWLSPMKRGRESSDGQHASLALPCPASRGGGVLLVSVFSPLNPSLSP